MAPITLSEYATHFAESPGYCDFARFGPVSRDVAATVATAMEHLASGKIDWSQFQGEEVAAREMAAELTGRSSADQVVLCPSATPGLLHLAFSVPSRPELEVLVGQAEFPGNVYPWLRAAQRGGPSVRFLDDGPITPERVADAIGPKVVALAVSAVDYRTGYRADLAALREVLGERLLLVDGIQAFGSLDMPWATADAVVVGGQKWLRAGWGTGFISLSERAVSELGAGTTGWWGMENPMDFSIHPAAAEPARSARRFALTAPDLVAAAALASALRLLREVSGAVISRAVVDRAELLVEGVKAAGGRLLCEPERGRGSGIVSFSLPGVSAEELAAFLATHGIVVSGRPGYVRVAPHATTPIASLERLCTLVRDAPH